jgi:hypothetical protein
MRSGLVRHVVAQAVSVRRVPLTLEGGIGPGTNEVEPLLDKHKGPDCVSVKASASERNSVPPTRKDPFDGDSRPRNA